VPAWLQGTVIVGGSVLLALAGMFLVRRVVPHSVLREQNEVAGFLIAVLGVAYAVLLAFVVIAVWEEFEEARVTAEQEAHAVAGVWRDAQAFPEPTRGRVMRLCNDYTQTVIEEEWPAMARGEQSLRAWQQVDALWQAVIGVTPRSAREETFHTHIVEQLEALGGARRMRLLASRSGVPGIIWLVLIGGSVITVGFTYFFGVRSARAQALMTVALTGIVALCLFLVVAINYPFTGDLHIEPEAFHLVLEMFERSEGAPAAQR
jgi:hypothetical protein